MNDAVAEKLKFSPDVVVIPCEESLLIDGLATDEVLSGPIAQSVLSDVIAMLDGTRTREDVYALLVGIPRRYVEEAIDTLCEWGYVREADCLSIAEHAIPPNVESFLRRATLARRRPASRSVLLVAEQQVLIYASQRMRPMSTSLERLLATSGISSKRETQQTLGSPGGLSRFNIVVFLSEADNDATGAVRCRNHGAVRPVLLSHTRPDGTFYIGPYINLCTRCFGEMLHRSENVNSVEEVGTTTLSAMWMPLLSLEIFHFLYETGYRLTIGQRRRVDAHGDSTHVLVDTVTQVAWQDDPPREQITTQSAPGRIAPLWYERYVQHDRRHDSAYATASLHYSGERNLPKQLHCGRRQNLPSSKLFFSESVSQAILGRSRPTAALTPEKLAALLCLSGGFRQDDSHKIRRWIPTAGNLNSSEFYVYCHAVPGIAKGLYYYNPLEHVLVEIRDAFDDVLQDMPERASGGAASAEPSAILFAVGNLHRLSGKYGAFGYKLMHLDAGAGIAQITQAAHAQGLATQLYPDSLFGSCKVLLQLQPQEHLTAVIGLYDRQAKQTACIPVPAKVGYSDEGQSQSVTGDRSIDDLIELLEHDRYDHARIAVDNHSVQKVVRSLVSCWQVVQRKWMEGFVQQQSLGQVYADRRSVRSYSERLVSRDVLSRVLKLACAADARRHRLQNSRSVDIEPIVIVRGRSEISAGVYQYKAGSFRRIGSSFSEEIAERLILQKELREAPLLIWFSASVGQACTIAGSSGYREILIRCGAMAHDSLTAANGHGLKGVLVGGLRSVEAPSWMGFDLANRVGILGVCLGYENVPE